MADHGPHFEQKLFGPHGPVRIGCAPFSVLRRGPVRMVRGPQTCPEPHLRGPRGPLISGPKCDASATSGRNNLAGI